VGHKLAACVVTSIIALAACGGNGGSSHATDSSGALVVDGQTVADAQLLQQARDEGTVKVYTATTIGYEEMWEEFTKDTGIKVEGLRLTTEDLTQRVLTEARAGKFDADVIGPMPDFGAWRDINEAGILAPHLLPAELGIDDQYRGPDGIYYITSIGVNTLAYNSGVLPEGVTVEGWQDLLRPELAGGKIDFKPAPAGSTGYAINFFMRSKYGAEYLEKLAAQDPVFDESIAAVSERLARGEVAVAISRPGDLGESMENGAPIKLVWPHDGVPGAYWAIGVTKPGKHPSAGQVYENWIMAKRGQTLISELVKDYPVAPGAPQPTQNGEPLPTLEEAKPFMGTYEDYLGNRSSWTEDWTRIFRYSA
jgi:iron(III) transport system substrate-binding protein